MGRYIDADAAVELARLTYCKGCNSYNGVMCRACAFDDAMSFIDDFPESDVVPKSEAEKLQEAYNNRLAKDIQTNADFVKYAKAEVAREIFEEIENLFAVENFRLICNRQAFAELKKKYTGGE